MADQQADILIVGGGVVGWSISYAMRARGRDVTIVDASEFGTSCSFENAGQLVPSHMKPLCVPGVVGQALRWMLSPTSPFKLHLRPDPTLLRWLWSFWRHCNRRHMQACIPLLARLQLENRKLLAAITEREDLDCHFQQRGLLLLFREQSQQEGQRLVAEAKEEGMRATYCGCPEELLRFDSALPPGAATDGVYYEDDAHLDPGQFVHCLAERCQSNGVAFVGSSRVHNFEQSGNRLTHVHTDQGSFTANEVVLAAGSATPALAKSIGLRAPIQPGKGYSLTFAAPEHSPTLPLILGDDRVVVTPMGDQLRVSGTMEIGARNTNIDQRRTGAILETFRRWFPAVEVPPTESMRTWAGLRPCTPDGLPIIGRASGFANLTVAAGHAMLGLSMAAITGRIAADAIDRIESSSDLTLLSPDRFS